MIFLIECFQFLIRLSFIMVLAIPCWGKLLLERTMAFCEASYQPAKMNKMEGTVIKNSQKNDYAKPVYFVRSINNSATGKNDLYIIIRGSGSDADWKTDMTMLEKKYEKGNFYAHGGFLDAAVYVFKGVEEYLQSNLYDNVYITGHSYGASVTTVLQLVCWANGYETNAIAYAPAPCISNHYTKPLDHLATFVNEYDIVCSLSINNAYTVFQSAIPSKEGIASNALKLSIKIALSAVKNFGKQFSDNIVNNLMNNVDTIVSELIKMKQGKKENVKTLIGNCFRISKDSSYKNKAINDLKFKGETFNYLSLTPSAVQNHYPADYVSGIKLIKNF